MTDDGLGVWERFRAGWTGVESEGVLHVLRPAGAGDPFSAIPPELCGLWIITSDNPGGIVRDDRINVERRNELRAEIVSMRLGGVLEGFHQARGAEDGSWTGAEYGVAVRCTEETAVNLGHAYGQLAVYHLVPEGRRLVPCIMLKRGEIVAVQPMIHTSMTWGR